MNSPDKRSEVQKMRLVTRNEMEKEREMLDGGGWRSCQGQIPEKYRGARFANVVGLDICLASFLAYLVTYVELFRRRSGLAISSSLQHELSFTICAEIAKKKFFSPLLFSLGHSVTGRGKR